MSPATKAPSSCRRPPRANTAKDDCTDTGDTSTEADDENTAREAGEDGSRNGCETFAAEAATAGRTTACTTSPASTMEETR